MNASRPDHERSRGAALAEFALILPWILLLVVATIDYGHLIQTRLIITNLSREGASIASRAATVDSEITKMMTASGSPLKMAAADVRMYVSRIRAGDTKNTPKPKIITQVTSGTLSSSSKIVSSSATLGLTQKVYDHLVFKTANNTANIAEVTVVEIFYKYKPITPLPNFLPSFDKGGFIMYSKAVF